jgi:hypothetical protein
MLVECPMILETMKTGDDTCTHEIPRPERSCVSSPLFQQAARRKGPRPCGCHRYLQGKECSWGQGSVPRAICYGLFCNLALSGDQNSVLMQ